MNIVQKWLKGLKSKSTDVSNDVELSTKLAEEITKTLQESTQSKVQEDSLELQSTLKLAIETVARPTNPKQGSKVIVLDETTSIIIGHDDWIGHVLSCDPVEGDIGGTEPLEDKVVKVRSSKKLCTWCLSPRLPNTYSRVMTWHEDGEWIHHQYCQDCCNAFIQNDYGHDHNGLPDHFEEYEDVSDNMQWENRDNVRKLNEKLLKGNEQAPDEVKFQLLKGSM